MSLEHLNLTQKDLKAEVKDLWFGGTEPGYVGLCLAGEAGELLEVVLAAHVAKSSGKIANYLKKMGRSPEHREDKLAEIRSEIPDIKFYVAMLENLLSIDPDEDWHRKMNHNERKYGRPLKERPFACECVECCKIEGKPYVRD